MAGLGIVFLLIGGLIMFVGGIMFLIEAFKQSILWLLGCLFFWPVQIAFLIMHWDVAKKPFLIELAGLPFIVIGMMLGAGANGA